MNGRATIAGGLAVIAALLIGCACGIAIKADKPPLYYSESERDGMTMVCTNERTGGWTGECSAIASPQ